MLGPRLALRTRIRTPPPGPRASILYKTHLQTIHGCLGNGRAALGILGRPPRGWAMTLTMDTPSSMGRAGFSGISQSLKTAGVL
jgi:hypothetical protein